MNRIVSSSTGKITVVLRISHQRHNVPSCLQINTDSLDDALHDISAACMRGVQALPSNPISTCVREEVRVLAATIRVLKGLKSQDLSERHWGRIRALVPNLPTDCSSSSLCVGDVRKFGVIDAQDRCAVPSAPLLIATSADC